MIGHTYFATTPKGMEPLLVAELRQLGAQKVAAGSAGVTFTGGLKIAYRACLWSRLANRILLPIGAFPAADEKALYNEVRALDWSAHLSSASTLAVNVHSAKSIITHTHFAAQRIKDAIVDQFRAVDGNRPSVDRDQPDVRINAYLFRNRLRLSLDLSGNSLHQRGYRQSDSGAPLKENLAAAILLFADWPTIAAKGGSFLDPMCGSGTLLIEAAMIAADIAPGLKRHHYGFDGWRGHNASLWQALLEEAKARRATGLLSLPEITGRDIDAKAVGIARHNIANSGLNEHIHVTTGAIEAHKPAVTSNTGLIAVNPPYGKRMDADAGPAKCYAALGRMLRNHRGWDAAVLTGNPTLTHRFKLTPQVSKNLNNGALACKLQLYQIRTGTPGASTAQRENLAEENPPDNPNPPGQAGTEGAAMFANRLAKNLKVLSAWAKNAGIDCYRVYDADLPEYAVAIDLYPGADAVLRVHVQEYAAPKTVDASLAQTRLQQIMQIIPPVLNCEAHQVYLKVRTRQRGSGQYQKLSRYAQFYAVKESGCQLLVNLADYQDCGLFLDHRKVRQKIHKLVSGKRFLNLFAYTGAASVLAATGGASQVTTLDMSATYLDWAKKNFSLNGLSGDHYQFIRTDCLAWLNRPPEQLRYDVILLDPPTFSNSRRMSSHWDVQRDHAKLIERSMTHLNENGLLLFSTNRRRFKLDSAIERNFSCREISGQTVPRDFSRNRHIHHCWEISA